MTLDFSKLNGLITAVIQDHATGRVLMVGFMNEEAFHKYRGIRVCHVLLAARATSCGSKASHPAISWWLFKHISTDCDLDARVADPGGGAFLARASASREGYQELLLPQARGRRMERVRAARL